MAVYGLGATVGQVPFTGYTNTLGSTVANAGATSGYVQNNGITQGDSDVARIFRNGAATAAATQLLATLIGAVAGTTATKTKAQVRAQNGSDVGSPQIETINLVNRATTAADVTAFKALFARTVFPTTYAPDLSGNGGGGHVNY